MKNPIRIVVANPNPLFRLGVMYFLQSYPGLRVVGEASSGNEVLAQAKQLLPDVVLMEVDMRSTVNGLEAIRLIKRILPATRIVILTASQEHMVDAINGGVEGYLPKGIEPKVLVETIKGVCRGEIHVASHDASHHVSVSGIPPTNTRLRSHHPRTVNLAQQRCMASLTSRQRDVLAHLAKNHTDKEIARALHIAESTVTSHIKGILAKLELENRREAVAFALRKSRTRANQ